MNSRRMALPTFHDSGGGHGGDVGRLYQVDMVAEGLVDRKTALMRLEAAKIESLLHKQLDAKVIKSSKPIGKGIFAGIERFGGLVVLCNSCCCDVVPCAFCVIIMLLSGLPASPGAAVGQLVLLIPHDHDPHRSTNTNNHPWALLKPRFPQVFSADDAVQWKEQGKRVILCRLETSPEDITGMSASQGILTARGGMTSHAAVQGGGAWGGGLYYTNLHI